MAALHRLDEVARDLQAAGHEGSGGVELAGADQREVGVREVQDRVNLVVPSGTRTQAASFDAQRREFRKWLCLGGTFGSGIVLSVNNSFERIFTVP